MFSLFILFNPVFGCSSYEYYDAPASSSSTVPVTEGPDHKRLQEGWGGFQVPDELEAQWSNWLEDYKKKREAEMEEDPSKYKNERGPGSGWPSSWIGLGGGFAGAEPPPWAYVPINTGLPDFCYEPPKLGTCTENHTRWAFNPYLATCVEFSYSGCYGNQNNFMTMEKCEQSCMKMPVNGCNPKKKQYVEDIVP